MMLCEVSHIATSHKMCKVCVIYVAEVWKILLRKKLPQDKGKVLQMLKC